MAHRRVPSSGSSVPSLNSRAQMRQRSPAGTQVDERPVELCIGIFDEPDRNLLVRRGCCL